jgi:mannose-1-phosphate guanylyltransferase/mannose-6-phosphate isomerase
MGQHAFMKILILSGGIGTGLWPLSREEYPKQFLGILEGKSLLRLTVERFLKFCAPQDIFIVTQKDKKFLVQREVERYGLLEPQFICEPFMRGTALAVLLGITYLRELTGESDEIICVAPSDHYMEREEEFLLALERMKNVPPNFYVLLGIPPRGPYPGYGYVKQGELWGEAFFDRLVFEKSKNLLLFPCDPGWSDIGTFDALYGLWESDNHSIRSLESRGNLVIETGRKLVVLIGIEETTVVDTEDVLLLVRRGKGYQVKTLLQDFEREDTKVVRSGLTSYRPWGYFKVLEEWERFKIKRLVVYPGMSLSLQLHHHRTEHWVVVRGTAKVTVGDKVSFLHEGESIFIPKSTQHRLENPGKVDLEVIEVQNGEYLEEDDIVRLEDIWERE